MDYSNENQYYEIDYQEYYLIKDNIIYKITVIKSKNQIIVNYRNYSISFNLIELSILIKKNLSNIYKSYEYINNIFCENKVKIEKFIINKEMQLIFKIDNNKEIEITLLYEKEKNNFILNEINKLKNDINDLKIENNKLKNKIESLKIIDDNPTDIELLSDITNNSFSSINIDNTFTIFQSIKDILYLVYSTINKSIISYNLNEQKIIKELKNYHNEYITNFRHYLDEINNRDLLISISQRDNNIRLWEVNNWECILNIPHANENGILYSACFLHDNNESYIISSNCDWDENSENIKIFDFNGNITKEINDSNEITFYINSFYDELSLKHFIITGNWKYIISYNYNNNQLYHKYYDDNDDEDNCSHFIVNININKKQIQLIESCDDGNIRIWDFHSAKLLNKIKINDGNLYGICLWNNNFLFVACNDKTIKLIDLKTGLIVKSLEGHNSDILTIKKAIHPKYGECLISQGLANDQIKIWINSK